MNSKILMAFGLLIGSAFIARAATHTANDDVSLTPYLGCYDKDRVEKILTDGAFMTLYRAKGPDGRVNELWINGTGITTTISFKDPKSNDHTSIKQVCVTNVTRDTVYNSALIEALGKDVSEDSSK